MTTHEDAAPVWHGAGIELPAEWRWANHLA